MLKIVSIRIENLFEYQNALFGGEGILAEKCVLKEGHGGIKGWDQLFVALGSIFDIHRGFDCRMIMNMVDNVIISLAFKDVIKDISLCPTTVYKVKFKPNNKYPFYIEESITGIPLHNYSDSCYVSNYDLILRFSEWVRSWKFRHDYIKLGESHIFYRYQYQSLQFEPGMEIPPTPKEYIGADEYVAEKNRNGIVFKFRNSF